MNGGRFEFTQPLSRRLVCCFCFVPRLWSHCLSFLTMAVFRGTIRHEGRGRSVLESGMCNRGDQYD